MQMEGTSGAPLMLFAEAGFTRLSPGPPVTKMAMTGGVLSTPRTFGQDANGELYVASSTTVFRIEA